MAYPSHVAAALSGATIRQLTYWRQRRNGQPPLLVPEFRTGQRVLYSFRDVVALRTFVYLREDLPLQRIRKALATLREFEDIGHLSSYKLYVSGRSIVWRDDNDRFVDLVERPGHFRLKVAMLDVLGPFTNRQGADVLPLQRPLERVEVDPGIRGGYPVVAGTRIPFDLVAGLVADGVRAEDVAEFYPMVDAESARDAFRFFQLTEGLRGNEVLVATA